MPTKGDSKEHRKTHSRRFFSFDSTKSTKSATSSSRRSSTDTIETKGDSPGLNHDLSDVREGDSEDTIFFPHNVINAEPESIPQVTSPRLQPVRPVPIRPARSSTPDSQLTSTSTSTKARWDNLRQHVLPSLSRPGTPPQRSGSAQSHYPNLQNSRSTTPKPSRLVRLGFKQVVESAREAVDENRKLGEELLRACALARYWDANKKEGQASNPNLTGTTSTAASSNINTSSKKFEYLLRPQSIMSLSTSSLTSSSSTPPTLNHLYRLLVYHSALPLESGRTVGVYLPHESQVLATLLCPFLLPAKYPAASLEEERMLAVEAFEMLNKSWVAPDELATVERCLWCTKAAASLGPSPTRSRILSPLWRILVPGDKNRVLLTGQGFQSVASGLFVLLATLHQPSTPMDPPSVSYMSSTPSGLGQISHPDIHTLQDLMNQFISGSFGELDDDRIEEEYGVEFANNDRQHLGTIRLAVFQEALVNTIEYCHGMAEWMLESLPEEYWPVPTGDAPTALQGTICCRKLATFCRVATTLLSSSITHSTSSSSPSPSSPESISHTVSSSSSSIYTLNTPPKGVALLRRLALLLQSRVIPEADALESASDIKTKVVSETRMQIARVLLDMICLDLDGGFEQGSPRDDVFGNAADGAKELFSWSIKLLCGWYTAGDKTPWRDVLEKTFHQIIIGEWQPKLRILSAVLRSFPDVVRKSVFSAIFPAFNDQLVEDPPPYPSLELSTLLTSLSKIYPPIFYRPLFACAASDKEFTVVNHLCTLEVHAKYVKDYWVRDVDMMCVALLGDAGRNSNAGDMPGQWGVAKLGQLVLLIELIGHIQDIRHEKEGASSGSEILFMDINRFSTSLEMKLHRLMETKERTTFLPPSQRMLFSILFREFRLLTRSLKPAPWLHHMLGWFNEYCADEDADDLEQEVISSVERIQGLYLAAQAGVQQGQTRHTSLLSAPAGRPTTINANASVKPFDLAATLVEHRKLIDSLSKGYPSRALKLFVTIWALISASDYQRLGPLLWEHFLLDNADPSLTASACFLLMQCAEKTPMDLLAGIEVDLRTSNEFTRLEAVRKISILINWRFQIMSQNFITDRAHRPFKLARAPLPFVATDLGTSVYVHWEEADETGDKDDVPVELRKRLADLGWAEEEANTVDPQQEWIKTPFSLLPANQLDRMEVGTVDPAPSPLPSPQPSPKKPRGRRDHLQALQQAEDAAALLRRNSSSGGPTSGVKRRAVFVPALTSVFASLAKLVFDPSFVVASAARATIMDLMRNDPALLSRSILDLFSGDHKDIKAAASTFAALMHIRRVLPPALTHNIFNNIAGFLKHATREVEISDTLQDFGLVLPALANIATQVSEMSIKEIRRAKMEPFLIPTGTLWFSSAAPKGPMFPRNSGSSLNPFEPVSEKLISVTMIRTAQNIFFLSMLKRNFQDVQVVRKHMSRLVLPSLDDQPFTKALDVQDFMPRKRIVDVRPSSRNRTVENLSLMLSRSYILLVAQIFRSMSRYLNDRNELAVLVDGLNRCLLAHGNDINIISQVLIALMVASTRFRRLFTAGGGYTLFMPVIVKIYTENPSHPGIRLAIEYAINRFYALHKESFLFQSLNTIGQVAMLPDLDAHWFSEGVYNLYFSLRKPVQSSVIDVAGIQGANKAQEREALIIDTADQKPQTFLAAIRRVESQTGPQMFFQIPDEYVNTGLKMDDFIKLFLTVIAHNPTISRAQHFLRLLRLLTPHLYHASKEARKTLADGIAAIGPVLMKVLSKPKAGDKDNLQNEEVAFLPSDTGMETHSSEKSKSTSDSKSLRLDYLKLMLSFGEAGGQVSSSLFLQGLEVLKGLLKDSTEASSDTLGSFLGDFVRMLLLREDLLAPKAVATFLTDLSPILSAYSATVDFTGVYETVLRLARMPLYANDPHFSQALVREVCKAGLTVCDLAASGNFLMTLQCRPILIFLFAEAIFLEGTDFIVELEKRPPTYTFLAGIILPFALALKTEAQLMSDGTRTDHHRQILQSAWVRLLHHCMTACQKSRKDEDIIRRGIRSFGGSLRSKNSDKGRAEASFWRSHLPTFVLSLQVIKVIITRAGNDISLPRSAIWERIAAFLTQMLADGSADFALRTESNSAVATPTASPRTSGQFQMSNSGSSLFISTTDLPRPSSSFSHISKTTSYSSPSMVDYALWSMLEFVCAYRNPLRTHLKLLTMEKVLSLDQELQYHDSKNRAWSPFPASPSSPRLSASIFSKSRKRVSGLPVPSPEGSPRIMPSTSNLLPSPSLLEIPSRLDIPSRRPGYQISPISPSESHPGLPKIVHLGPTSPSAFAPISSPLVGAGLTSTSAKDTEGEGATSSVKSTKVKSLVLIRETYRRIRGVQAFMGYSLLLPIPEAHNSSMIQDAEVPIETWSKQQALQAVAQETAELLKEFDEPLGFEDSVMVEVEPTSFANHNANS